MGEIARHMPENAQRRGTAPVGFSVHRLPIDPHSGPQYTAIASAIEQSSDNSLTGL